MFRKASADAVDLISRLLEYTPTQRLSAIEAICHPFFDELRDPNTRLPDSRHPNGAVKDLPKLFDFTRHGTSSPDVHADIDALTRDTRTLNRSGAEPPAGSSARPPGAGGPWNPSGQVCSHDERGDAGALGLRTWPWMHGLMEALPRTPSVWTGSSVHRGSHPVLGRIDSCRCGNFPLTHDSWCMFRAGPTSSCCGTTAPHGSLPSPPADRRSRHVSPPSAKAITLSFEALAV